MTEIAEMDRPAEEETGLWSRLKAGTRGTHERLDSAIMARRPFESRARYGMFVLVQHDFHSIVSPLYQHAGLAALLPDLDSRDRLPAVEQDLHDLGLAVPSHQSVRSEFDIANALGWLYVAEGSNLGAAFPLKAARQLDLSAAPEGRGLHWKTFTGALDAIGLSTDEEARVIVGANDAFAQVLSSVERRFGAARE